MFAHTCRRALRFAAVSFLVAGPASAAGGWPDQNAPGTLDLFHDWVVGCDQSLTCTALGLAPETEIGGAFLKVAVAMVGREPSATLYLAPDEAGAPPIEVGVRVVGPHGTLYHGSWRAEPDPDDDRELLWAASPGRERAAFFAALLAGDRLEARMGEEYVVSLRGSTAALLRIDDQQGRAGTTQAIVRRGAAPWKAGADWPPPELRWIAALPLDATDAALPSEVPRNADPDCAAVPPLAVRVREDTTLWGVCDFRANTNTLHRFWILDGAGVRPALLPMTASTADPMVLFNAEADDGWVLWSRSLGRGLGDCGEVTGYQWDEPSGPALAFYAEMPICRGVPQAHWPVLYDVVQYPDAHEPERGSEP
jgi:hypothetical protein